MTLGGRRFLLSMAIIAASISLALGLTLPGIRLTRFYFFSTEYSLISTVYTLISRNQIFLGSLVFIFSIMLPVFKLCYLVVLTTMPDDILRQYRHVKALEWLGKWSMHDVLVLALMIFFIKSQGVYDAKSLSGVYFFTAAVLLMILAYTWLNRLSPVRALPLPAGEQDIGHQVRAAHPPGGISCWRCSFWSRPSALPWA